MYKNISKTAPAALALALALAMPAAAFADPVSATTDGVGYTSSTDVDQKYREVVNTDVTAVVDSTTGTWSDGEATFTNGSYVVTIPTTVGFKNVNVGKLDLTAPYDVNVKGVIGTGDRITCTVGYSQEMSGALVGSNTGMVGGVGPYSEFSDGGQLNMELTQGKTSWSADEVSTLAEDGETVIGTTGTDSLHFTGSVRSASTFQEPLAYNFTTGYANVGAWLNRDQTGTN